MDREDRIDIYTLPPNFAEEGTMFSGRIKSRNVVETAIILMVLVPLLFSLEATVKAKMYISMIMIVPAVVLAVIGIQGESLFAFIASFFRYLRRRRYLAVPDERYRLEQNRKKEKVRKGEAQIHGKKEKSSGKGENKKNRKRDAEEFPKATKPRMEKKTEKNKEGFKTGVEAKTEGTASGRETGKGKKEGKK